MPHFPIMMNFKVVNEKLEAKDVDPNCIWCSPTINISNYHDVNLSLNASENGGFENDDIFIQNIV